jgi:hypothetical protein
MSLPLVLACIWALAATATALMPMRWQVWPGIPLLVTAPVLIGWIGMRHGWLVLMLALLAFLSMFRRPLVYLVLRAMGRPVEPPGRGPQP